MKTVFQKVGQAPIARFNPKFFSMNGDCLYYTNGDSRDVVARFKYPEQKRKRKAWTRFLVDNFTVAEYFGHKASGMAPTVILESKGYSVYSEMASVAYETTHHITDDVSPIGVKNV